MATDPWTDAMRAGDFAAAWRISDAILAERVTRGDDCRQAPRHCQFIWRGQPLADRRVLVRCYHGLGDTLQFIRFAAPLARIARSTLYWVQPVLLDLVARVAGVQRVLPLHDGVPDCEYDVDIELMEVPHALRITPESLGSGPYLPRNADPRGSRRAAPAPLAVGLCWIAGDWDASRSVPVECLVPLTQVPGVRLHSLQYPPASTRTLGGLPDLGCRDIGELAGRMASLDLVISVDTMVAHLAGGLGLRAWTLLAYDCDWRWMRGRADTPWYPDMRLYRQRAPGEWGEVPGRVAADLAAAARAGG
jgi:hypothetical protein